MTSDETQHVPDGPLPAASEPAAADAPSFGRYKTSSTLGAGAMGTVYRAHDDMLGRDVAIKSLTASGELGVRERFVREARAIGAVHHPNILAIHDVGEQAGTPYLVMELAAGGSLRERIKAAAPLPIETVRDVGVHIARALAAAHAAGIVHRDVKPANILCATPVEHPPLWKLADFGIAHMPDSTLTITGQFLGSPSYAAPESLRAGQFGPASDVYSLGATLYEALVGSPPHGNHDMQSIVRKLEQEAPSLQAKNPAAPSALADPIMAAIASDPAKRPSADQLARMLAQESDPAVAAAAGVGAASAAPAGVASAAPTAARAGSSMKWFALGLAAIAALAIALAIRERSSPSASAGAPADRGRTAPTTDERAADRAGRGGDTDDPGDDPTTDPGTGAEDDRDPFDSADTPMVVDQYGNPVDEETARKILEEMERDANDAYAHPGKGKGRGRGKKKHK